MEEKRLSDFICVAIEREEEAYTFYMDIYQRVQDKSTKDALEFLAGEEKKHREFLISYRDGKLGRDALKTSHVIDYKIAEHLAKPEIKEQMESQDIYLIAAHKELVSYEFYKTLAEIHPPGMVKDMLLKMASEELKHKEKVEYLYSNTAFPQTDGG